MTTVSWDYTKLAAHYDKRADYADAAIDELLKTAQIGAGGRVADIGAGTGKLTKKLLERGLVVDAVEPNDAMRSYGVKNTESPNVTWRDGTGEATGLPSGVYAGNFFGSSFNVVDSTKALQEVARMLSPGGWFGCMWNHRNLDDPVQAQIEGIIKRAVEGYDYGTRREDPTTIIDGFGQFGPVTGIEAGFLVTMSAEECVAAWRSHGTLQRNAGEKFDGIIADIAALLGDRPVDVPYTTRIWVAQMNA